MDSPMYGVTSITLHKKYHCKSIDIVVYFVELCKDGIENGWRKFGFYDMWTSKLDDVDENVIRIDGDEYTDEEFIKRFESPYTPCVVTNLLKAWPANENWTLKVRYMGISCTTSFTPFTN